MTTKAMQLLDRSTRLMVCRVCGSHHIANLHTGSFFKRGSWQCVDGCRPPTTIRK